MRLIFRHLLCSMRRKPVQPLIIVAVIVLSVIMAVCCFGLITAADQELDVRSTASTGRADICVSLGGNSSARFMTAKALESVVGDRGEVGGYYGLPLYDDGGDFIWGAATTFEDIDRIFDFAFTDYGTLTYGTLNTSAFISQRFAKERGLSVGSRITVRIAGAQKNYTVQGVHGYPFFGQYDVLVNSEGALGVLASQTPLFAALDGNNLPYSALFVRLYDKALTQSVLGDIINSEEYDGQNISECVPSGGDIELILLVILWTMTIFSVLVATAFIYSGLRELARIRAEENSSLILAGTPPIYMLIAVVAEMALYVILGGAVGIALSSALLSLFDVLVGFEYVSISLDFSAALFGGIFAFVVGMAGVCTYLALSPEGRAKKGRRLNVWLCVIVMALMSGGLLSFIWLSGKFYLVGTFVAAAGLLVLVLYGLPFAVSRLGDVTAGIIAHREKVRAPSACIAVNNVRRSAGILNFTRLAAFVVIIMIAIIACLSYGNSQAQSLNNLFGGDYIIANQSAVVRSKVEKLEETGSCYGIYIDGDAKLFGFKSLTVISAESTEIFSGGNGPRRLPTGGQIALSEAVALSYGLKPGDEVTLVMDNAEYSLVFSSYSDGVDNVAYIDGEFFNRAPNYLVVTSADGVGAEQYKSALFRVLSSDVPIVMRGEDLLRQQINVVSIFMAEAWLFFACNLAVAVIGLINILGITYSCRREEFALLRICGVTRGELARMIAAELIIMFLVAAVVGAVGGIVGCVCLDYGLRAFGFTLI